MMLNVFYFWYYCGRNLERHLLKIENDLASTVDKINTNLADTASLPSPTTSPTPPPRPPPRSALYNANVGVLQGQEFSWKDSLFPESFRNFPRTFFFSNFLRRDSRKFLRMF